MFAGQHAAPGLPQQCIVVANAQMIQQVLQLIEKERHVPERGVFFRKMGGTPIAQLVVMNHRIATVGNILEGIDIIVCTARAAMQDQQRRTATAEIASDAIPGLIRTKRRKAFVRYGKIHFVPLPRNPAAHDTGDWPAE
ncbi:hypothetical protein D3C84_744270 [compost metagenome]